MPLKSLLKRIGIRPQSGGVRTLGRSIMLAAIVGVVSGLGAILFHLMCLVITHFGLGELAHYEQGGPANEKEFRDIVPAAAQGDADGETPAPIPWMLILLPTAGGLLSGYIVYRFAPEAEGHGTDAAIKAYHSQGGFIRPQVPIVKMFSAAITLGTGGSGGREGPIAQIGAGFGSFLATRLKLSDNDRRLLMAAGLGAGIGAIFHAPLAGAIFAIEVLYRDPDFESEALIPAFISTTVAYSVFSLAFGASAFKPLFHVPELTFTRPLPLLVPLGALAVTMSLAALLYIKVFYGVRRFFKGIKRVPTYVRPVIGAALTGAVAVGLYYLLAARGAESQRDALSVLSFGYGYLQKLLDPAAGGSNMTAYILPVMLVVGFGKILTTALTIGSGGSGGVFGPSMVIGGTLGSLIGLFFHKIGFIDSGEIVIFTILGMASFFAAAANTPVSTLIMVTEMTASYALLMPSMWVCALAYLLKGRWTLYEEQVRNRLESPAHRGDFIIDVLKGLTVRTALGETHRKFITVPMGMPLPELSRLITSTTQTSFPVVDEDEQYYGLFSLQDIRQFLYESQVGPLAVAQDLASAGLEPLTLDLDLSSAITRFAQGRFEELPVVDPQQPRRVVGMLRRQDVIAVYERRLMEVRSAPSPRKQSVT